MKGGGDWDGRFSEKGRRERVASNEILAFSAEQASRLTGISKQRLQYWDRTGFFSPQYEDEDTGRPFRRLYSFRDLVGLRVLAELRDKHRVSLQMLRGVDKWLRDHYQTPWSSLTFYVSGRRVFYEDPDSKTLMAGRPGGQTAMRFDVEKIAGEMHAAVERMRRRGPDAVGQITRRRNVMHNAYVLAGTRILTESVWHLYQDGYDREQIKRQYPTLTNEDIDAAIAFEQDRHSKKRVS